MDYVNIELKIDDNKLEVGPNYDDIKWEVRRWKNDSVEAIYQHVNQSTVIAAAFTDIFNKKIDNVYVTRVRM